jgi:hypothetical protein
MAAMPLLDTVTDWLAEVAPMLVLGKFKLATDKVLTGACPVPDTLSDRAGALLVTVTKPLYEPTDGAKVTWKLQLPVIGTTQLLLTMLKPAGAPMASELSATLPVLVTYTSPDVTLLPVWTLAKLSAPVESDADACRPVPDRLTNFEPPPLAMLSVPEAAPIKVGEKVTL